VTETTAVFMDKAIYFIAVTPFDVTGRQELPRLFLNTGRIGLLKEGTKLILLSADLSAAFLQEPGI
jgi:hypothetical protein